MCGICGIVNTDGAGVSAEVLNEMALAIRHRGPDDDGFFVEKNIGLGMRRLSIIDLSTGKQPIHNENSTVWIVFNGEIYNYRELRAGLEKNGHKFYTQSDTEAIVHLYEEKGAACVNELNGMFAFAIYDKNNNSLFIARDRLGKKPLYYAHAGNSFIFASEVKSILKVPGIQRRLDPAAASLYLAYEYIPADHCIFQGVKKLLPGHCLVLQGKSVATQKYWDLDFEDKDGLNNFTLNEVKGRLDALLEDSVRRRLISDVPLGVFLSGGLDSSAVTAYMVRIMGNKNVKTFSIGFKEKSFDESAYAREIAHLFGTEHHEEMLDPAKMVEILPKVADFLDEPFADASVIPTYMLSEFTRRYVTVALGGDGGDELFAGYPTFQAHKLGLFYRKFPRFLMSPFEFIAKNLPVSFENISFDFKIKQFLKGIDYPIEHRQQVWLGAFTPKEQAALLMPEFAALSGNHGYDDIDGVLAGRAFRDEIEKAIYLYFKFYLADDILFKVDRASMAASLEARAPFLDYRVVEFVSALKSHWKLRGFTPKFILKETMKGVLPEHIINRSKKGFGIPVAKWFRNELRGMMQDVLGEGRLKQQGIFNPVFVQELIKGHLDGKSDNRKKLWTLFMFQLWHDRYITI
ncbi:MAG: asparagine synthase (glutamine-hydrolyzing) [Planctomycetes bacterium]|nr:asparagine synthase (glutamine-hydrolyzing) [Planctomycetota bacterium]